MAGVSVGVVHQPAPGETAIGDAYCVIERGDFVLVAAVDGLGHGEDAQHAARTAIDTIEAHPELPPHTLIERVHEAVRGTRGVVAAIARLEPDAGRMTFSAIGNIETRLVTLEKTFRPMSVNGIIGHQARRARVETLAYQAGDLLVMHSDGVSDRFDLSALARQRDPQMLANQLALAHGHGHDDQLLLVVRIEP